jgi:uncharacterized membrane protein YeiH
MTAYLLSLLGVGVFAASGALAAGRKGFDLIGVLVIAVATALGGGTIRDLLLGRHPIFWVADRNPLFVILVSSALTLIYVRFRRPPWASLLVVDAIGLAYFSISGAQLAEAQNLPGIVVVVMGTITGSAGGVLRDLLSGDVPVLLRDGDVYATAAIAGITIYVVLQALSIPVNLATAMGMITIATLRFAAIRWKIRVPVFKLPQDDIRAD